MATIDESKSYAELNNFFADLVESMLGLTQDNVRIQYQAEGQPMPKFGEDMVFINVQPEIDERNIYKSRQEVYNNTNDNFTYIQKSQRTLVAEFVFYGNHANENAKIVNESMYFPNYEYMLSQYDLALVPDRTDGPNKMPELVNGRWWNRSDLKMRFYNLVSYKTIIDRIANVEITVETEGGLIEHISE